METEIKKFLRKELLDAQDAIKGNKHLDIIKKKKSYIETNDIARSPTLQTVLMVEKFIDKHSGEYRKTELFNGLPKKVMWQTFQVIMEYLESINKVGYDNEGYVVYIWSPELGERYKERGDLAWKKKVK